MALLSVRWRFVLLLNLAVPCAANAQGPSGTGEQPLPKYHYTRSSTFTMPVNMSRELRAAIREVCLYVKAGHGNWVRHESAPNIVEHFSFKAPSDGEYWFSLVTVDKNGKASPIDLNQEPPSLRVVIDTQAPTFDIQSGTTNAGEICITCKMLDQNPDLATIKAVSRLEAVEIALLPVAGQPGVFKFPSKDLLAYPVRVSGADMCGNPGGREVLARELSAGLPPTETIDGAVTANKIEPRILPPSLHKPDALQEQMKQEPIKPPPFLPVVDRGLISLPPSVPPPAAVPTPQGADAAGVSPFAGMIPRQMLNSTLASVEYRVDQVGPSGVGKVEIYLTTDQGQTWKRHADDLDRRSPAEIELPGDGVYGIRLVVANGNGFGATAPVRGDLPMCWIEVDATPPVVQLRPIEPAMQNGCMEIRWTAADRNLGPEPVNLYFRTRVDSPWQVMARNLKNDGLYRWAFPRDMGSQFLIKIEVSDRAGNVARIESPNPIVLDMTEPRASVIGVTGVINQKVSPVGN